MEIREFVGVYNADGGVRGEVRYVVGHLLGRAECALCDITHSPVRRKKQWDRFVVDRGVPWRLLHLNEMPADVAALVEPLDDDNPNDRVLGIYRVRDPVIPQGPGLTRQQWLAGMR